MAMEQARETVENFRSAEGCANAVMQMASILSEEFSVDELFPRVVEHCIKLLNSDRATMFLVEGDKLWSKFAAEMEPIVLPIKEYAERGGGIRATWNLTRRVPAGPQE